MNVVVPWAVICGLALAASLLSLAAWFRSGAQYAVGEARAQDLQAASEIRLQALQATINALSAQLQEVQRQSVTMAAPPVPRAGFNLSRRSHALRMQRSGSSVEQIAAALEVPRQEVDLLIKVHRIVISQL